jgi:hypothetical protein
MSCGIYKLTSPNGKCYIGQSVNIERRLPRYKRLKCSNQPRIYRALKKYGVNNFKYEVIEECDRSMLTDRENYYMKLYDSIKNGYNCRPTTQRHYKGTTNRGHTCGLAICIDGVLYISISQASKLLGISYYIVRSRLNSKDIKFSNYCYKDTSRNPKRHYLPEVGNRSIKIRIGDTIYPSMREASKTLKMSLWTIRDRAYSPKEKFKDYQLLGRSCGYEPHSP